MKTAIELISAERTRQFTDEGWTTEHDDKHRAGEIAMAAASYALVPYVRGSGPFDSKGLLDCIWPWSISWWKPTPHDRVRELVKAGALIVAEIDRLQRIERKEMA